MEGKKNMVRWDQRRSLVKVGGGRESDERCREYIGLKGVILMSIYLVSY